jgi:hypothetical protein
MKENAKIKEAIKLDNNRCRQFISILNSPSVELPEQKEAIDYMNTGSKQFININSHPYNTELPEEYESMKPGVIYAYYDLYGKYPWEDNERE